MKVFIYSLIIFSAFQTHLIAQNRPIIDMHAHAWNVVQDGPDATENEAYLERFLSIADSFNVVRFVASGPHRFVEKWKDKAGDRMISGAMFPCIDGNPPNNGYGPCFPDNRSFPDINWLKEQFETGVYDVMGELTAPYAGISYNDHRMMPYYKLATEMDIPVAVHLQGAPPLTAQNCCPEFSLSYGQPLELEKVLIQYPDLRLYILHGNIKWIPSLILILQQYPNLYVDLTAYQAVMPREGFHELLREYKINGLIDRVMFATDNVPYEISIAAYQSAEFLTEDELDGIFCENAARFLREAELCK